MIRGLLGLGLFVALAVPVLADDDKANGTLGIGDPAPKLALKEFIKGEPVKAFDKDKIYVLEFWATWCGPCIAAIPHVTELQKKNPNVVFIGVNVWERDLEKVKPFVEEQGKKMDYRVAMDEGEAGKGTMAQTWLAAAGQNGIPCSMIVNGEGKIAWIGHPMRMDKPLSQIVSGKWDLATAAADFKKEREARAKMAALNANLRKALAKGPDEAVKVLDQALEASPEMEKSLGMTKFAILLRGDKLDQQIAYGERLIDKVLTDGESLNQLAWMIVDPEAKEKHDPKLQKMALKAAIKADQAMEGKDAAIADTLARAYFVTGDKAKALSTQERAVGLAKGTSMEKELQERLEEYKK